jgi:2-keto-4-pentenoate hydratase/2-oxohepta-3-ene-1,7-dioic acid hydratase in catechol pathway
LSIDADPEEGLRMKIVHFRADNRDLWGVVEYGRVVEIAGSIYEEFKHTDRSYSLEAVKVLPPVNPTKLIAVGLNYADHARETGTPIPQVPLIFLKAPSAIIGHDDPIVIPFAEDEVHFEAELTIIMKKRAKDLDPQEVYEYILGYACGNDVSDRTIQRADGGGGPTRAKSLDTFAPVGPFIATDVANPDNLTIECLVNGEIRQSSNTDQLVFDIPTLVSFVSRMMTLLPGDAIMTGTPPGVGPIRPGDVVEVRIEGIGTLRNPVRLATMRRVR